MCIYNVVEYSLLVSERIVSLYVPYYPQGYTTSWPLPFALASSA